MTKFLARLLGRDSHNSILAVDKTDEKMIVELTKQLAEDPGIRPYVDECETLLIRQKVRDSAIGGSGVRYFAVSALSLLLAFTVIYYVNAPDIYSAKIGEQRIVILDDQSKITLNTDTQVKVKYGQKARMIWLERGEAYFQVLPDKQRPFKVIAGNGTVRAVGTAFSVGIEEEEINVAVLEGSVDVLVNPRQENVESNETHNPKQSTDILPKTRTHLKVGEAVRFWANGVIGNVEAAKTSRINAWREGKLHFEDLNLEDAVIEHNRYTQKKIVIGSEDIRFLKINGVFEIGDTESLLFLLEGSLGLKSVKQSNVIVLLPQEDLRVVMDGTEQ